MNDHDLDVLLRHSLERDAATQPLAADLHQRSVAYGHRVIRRRRGAAASAVAFVVALVAVAGLAVANQKQIEPAKPSTPTLQSIARHVVGLDASAWTTSPWWYERITVRTAGHTDTAELWLSRLGPTKVLLDGSPTKIAIHGYDGHDVGKDGSWAGYAPYYTDPAKVYADVKAMTLSGVGSDIAPGPLAGDLFYGLASYLEKGEFTPQQRAAQLEALATVPGVRLGGLATDATGRQGLVVIPENAGLTQGQRYLVDPSSGLVIEAQTLDTSGAVTLRTTFVASAPVARDTVWPSGFAAVPPTTPSATLSGGLVKRIP